jgi:galactonate dehydratase
MIRRDFLTCALGAGGYGAFLSAARAQGTSRAPNLKIKTVRAALLRGAATCFVRVYTDKGLSGTGEISNSGGSADLINKEIGAGLEGRNPLDIEGIYFDLWSTATARGTGGAYLAAISGIEMALWDLAGKALGVPLYRLMSGRVRDKIAVYFNVRDPKQAADVVRSTGVRAIKTSLGPEIPAFGETMDAGKGMGLRLTTRQLEAIGSFAADMRAAVGREVEMAFNCHGRFDEESAIQVAKVVESSRPLWLEEPTMSDNPQLMLRVRRASRVPIACGQNVYTRYGFRPFIEQQAVSVVQPDMSKAGGLAETRKIAQMAETYTIEVSPHGMASPLGQQAYAHVCSTIPNFMILEWGSYFAEPLNRVVKRPAIADGFFEVPDAPGIGAEINQNALEEMLSPGDRLPE